MQSDRGRIGQWLTSLPIAHRGLHDHSNNIPENSLAAFENAAALGFPIELDIHLLQDQQIAVFHDQSLKRMAGVDRQIDEISSEEVVKFSLLDTKHQIPLLDEVLELIDGRVPLLIEIKNKGDQVGRLEKNLLQKLLRYNGEYAIESFNPLVLKWFREKAPQIVRGQLSTKFKNGSRIPFPYRFLLRNLFFNKISKPDFISYDIHCLPHIAVQRACRRRPLLGWTTKSVEDHAKAMHTCDNVIFEGYLPNSQGLAGDRLSCEEAS